jgi:hypothetical protein
VAAKSNNEVRVLFSAVLLQSDVDQKSIVLGLAHVAADTISALWMNGLQLRTRYHPVSDDPAFYNAWHRYSSSNHAISTRYSGEIHFTLRPQNVYSRPQSFPNAVQYLI